MVLVSAVRSWLTINLPHKPSKWLWGWLAGQRGHGRGGILQQMRRGGVVLKVVEVDKYPILGVVLQRFRRCLGNWHRRGRHVGRAVGEKKPHDPGDPA